MNEDRREIAISLLTSMSDKEFVELIYEAIRKRPVTSDTEEEQGHFVIGTATFDRDDKTWDLDVVSLHDPVQYISGFEQNAPLCQFGDCANCGYATVSWAKNAKCAVCGTAVYCT